MKFSYGLFVKLFVESVISVHIIKYNKTMNSRLSMSSYARVLLSTVYLSSIEIIEFQFLNLLSECYIAILI